MMFLPRIKEEIIKALLEGTQKSTVTIYRMVEKERVRLLLPNNSKGKSTAANYLASQFTDVSKCGLSKEELDDLRNLRRNDSQIIPKTHTKLVRKVRENVAIPSIDEKLIESFRLPKNIEKEVKIMAEVYSRVYLLENLLRFTIIQALTEKYGSSWWDKCRVSTRTRENVEKRIKDENINRWHGKRGSHPIFYTDFNDLRSVVVNNWEEFKELFPDQIWVQSRLKDVEPSRNIIAHNNPLPRREINRIKMIAEDFRKQLLEK